MRHRPIHGLSIAVAIVALIVTGGAAAEQARTRAEPQGFLQIPQIVGSSSAPRYKGWIELDHFTIDGPLRPTMTAGEVVVKKVLDKATPLLQEALQRGTRFQTIRLALRGEGDAPNTYLTITLVNARISKHRVEGRVEHLTIAYEGIIPSK